MYIKFPCWKPAPVSEALSGTSFSDLHPSVGYDRRIYVDDHLDDIVLLDLGILEASLVRQKLPREEPPLADDLDVLLFFQLFLQQGDGVRQAGCQTHILP